MGKNYIRKTTGVYNPVWLPAEEAVITASYYDGTEAAICAALPGRCWKNICVHASKMGVARQRRGEWPDEHVALLLEKYEVTGPSKMALLLPKSIIAIKAKARELGLKTNLLARPAKCRRPKAAAAPKPKSPAPAEAAPRPKAAKKPKPLRETLGKRVLTPTPNLAAQKAVVARKKEVQVAITAEEIRKLHPSDPARRAYTLNGVAGWQQYHNQQRQAA